MFHRFLLTLLVLLFFATVSVPVAMPQPLRTGGLPATGTVPLTPAVKLAILDKSEKQFFDEVAMTPTELLQAAIVLKDAPDLSTVFDSLVYRYSTLRLSPREQYDVVLTIGTGPLQELAQSPRMARMTQHQDLIVSLLAGAERHLNSRDAVEKVLLQDEPKTSVARMETVDILVRAGRAEIAQKYVSEILVAMPSDKESAEILDKIGSNVLYSLQQRDDLGSEIKKVVSHILVGAKNYWQNPAAIDRAIASLRSRDDTVQREAISTLWRGTTLAVSKLLATLGTTNDMNQVREIGDILITMKSDATDALVAMLDSNNPVAVQRAAELLVRILPLDQLAVTLPVLYRNDLPADVRAAVATSLQKRCGTVPSESESAALVFRRMSEYYSRARLPKIDEGMTTVWRWDDTAKTVTSTEEPWFSTLLTMTENLAADTVKLEPTNEKYRKHLILTQLERWGYELIRNESVNVDATGTTSAATVSSIPFELSSISPTDLEAAITVTSDTRHSAAAFAALTILQQQYKQGHISADDLLLPMAGGTGGTGFRAVVKACASSDPRTRFAATELVMQLNPKTPYPGSSLVSDAMVFFAKSLGERRAIVASPNQSEAMRLAGVLTDIGYKGETAVSSRGVMLAAIQSPDVELIWIDANCTNPSPLVLAQDLRADIRTAKIPIVVLTTDEVLLRQGPPRTPRSQMSDAEIAALSPFAAKIDAMILPYPLTDAAAEWVANILQNTVQNGKDTEPMSPDTRLKQAKKAAAWLLDVVKRQSATSEGAVAVKLYHLENLPELALGLMYSPKHTYVGLELTSLLRSNECQVAIAEMAMQAMYPLAARQKAATAFMESVARHGVLLRGQQIRRLYDRYNASSLESKESQDILASLLDTMENSVPGK